MGAQDPLIFDTALPWPVPLGVPRWDQARAAKPSIDNGFKEASDPCRVLCFMAIPSKCAKILARYSAEVAVDGSHMHLDVWMMQFLLPANQLG